MENLTLFGEVGFDVTAEQTAAFLAALPDKEPLHVKINSAGGSLQEAVAIYNLLRGHNGYVTVEIVGWALSAASLIAMAGNTVEAHENSLVMVHAPWATTGGNAVELRETADQLDIAKSTMVRAYLSAGIERAKVERWLSGDRDYWFTAEEAREAGLIDEVIGAEQAVDFRNCPFAIPKEKLERISMKQPSYMASLSGKLNATFNPKEKTRQRQRQEVARAEAERQEDIRRRIARWKDYEGAQAVLDTCLDDPRCTPEMAGRRMLGHLAEGVDPLQGPSHFGEGSFGMPSQDWRVENFKRVAADALLMRAGLPVKDPHPAASDLRGKPVAALAENLLSLMGKRIDGSGPGAIMRAAMTTSDFPQLLGDITGRALRQGYERAPATHALWTAEREVTDFRKRTLIQLSEAPGLEKVNEGAEYTNSFFSESAETFSIETFGRIVALTRQALVNDDLDAFTRIPSAFGASARRKEADLVYGKLTGNPAMSDGKALFHASHGNLASTGGALSVVSLGRARSAMRQQTGIRGLDYIDPQPAFLIVPTALETEAEELLASLVDPAKQNDTGNPLWIRGLTLVADPRLDEVSSTAWYLAASPNQIDTITRAYLLGEARPYVEESDEFRRDVTSFKCRLDVGVGVIDWRGLYKDPGQ